MKTLSVTVSFRERIALPPGVQLDVQVLEVVNPDRHPVAIVSQRFAMTTVPMTVSLTYDPKVVRKETRYAVFAAIRSPDGQQIFRATKTLDGVVGSGQAAINVLLMMLPEGDVNAAVPRRISGVAWTAKEVFGEAWPNDDPATLVIDDEMNVSVFGGCNRFRGQLQPSDRGLAFPDNMAGTMMACPDETEAQERRFLAALAQVSDYVRYGAGLVMEDFDGRAVLHFIETPE
ncbi:META domain-containing protein [Actibacterium sp. XHP0104]|uniref:META domain-containing protein n=1 Tax=Actibacterium sp. XHP0104 TaxID=2984335 RepID=UPI0021E79E96|nr:META domain-containing protein [Actibacterium sp. XHP0104]MCV2882466.1 META domain-containing protein [Actibacterium sp. XHP0104]